MVQNSVPTTDHAAITPREDIEMLKIAHLKNAMQMLGDAMRLPRKPRSDAKAEAMMARDIMAAPSAEPRVVPMNSLGNIDDPNDLPGMAAEDVIDPHAAPLVSLGQGQYRTDIVGRPAPRVVDPLVQVYDQCDKMARLPDEPEPVTDIEAAISLRVVGDFRPARCADLTDPAEPASFSCRKVYLARSLHALILHGFAQNLYARGQEPGRIRFMAEVLNMSLSPINMDAIDEAELESICDAALNAHFPSR
jgi:hypothetical protein